MKNKKAIITGGSRGLGKATAIAFAKEGIDVAITGRNEKALKETVSELETIGVKATYAVFDVGNYEEVKTGIKSIIDTLGTVDILVNNAGIAAFGTFNDMEVSQWSQIIQTNVMGMYYVTKEVLPYLIDKNEGDIINVSSTAGLSGNASTSAYSASKFAVIGMSESLMKEVRKNNIRVCTLTPSTIASDMSIDLGIATKDSEDSVLQPEDFAELIVAGLKLPRRAMLKGAALWSTNP
ncbi:3-ketoacyl-ACP reductase [Algibacter lectus]|uniref:3-oxoacyl-[acyl-carrier protein] reductase n=1 Tax=Algibacter lectus TaxID=221126 RepID=A0A090VIG1_9FLAO|nr:3-ketoacyl-ACP reductase [Algibacter lectus]MDO7138567.1 3-ketoacyl-ACP reductase [Algibacter lectus]MWW26709.1 3-ketoacyl-ACP reductase [Algibacter lectus]TDY65447.1 3-oxoacyl-[acyl-carrier protein] reductase [Algibacter lectus]SFD64642.1 3-oxoacyl-[acyl-carrier protein] reductase [Algibacter lectus]GAL64491.1 3-oxoacyl-[acyl-carrier protein] reductase [Algibacter lectus]